jgi:hypothetical protein
MGVKSTGLNSEPGRACWICVSSAPSRRRRCAQREGTLPTAAPTGTGTADVAGSSE